MNIVKTFSVLAVVAACAGCASQMLSDERLRAHTAPLVGVSASDLTVLNRSEQGTNTYYTVKTNAGAEYQCSINGGGVLAAGMVQGGQCAKKTGSAKPVDSIQEASKPANCQVSPSRLASRSRSNCCRLALARSSAGEEACSAALQSKSNGFGTQTKKSSMIQPDQKR